MNGKETNQGVLDAQREHWQRTFAGSPEMFGREPSEAARRAAEFFGKEGKRKVLELGCGQGRDTLFLAGSGFEVTALDYSAPGLQEVGAKAQEMGLREGLKTVCHDVRKRLPFEDASFDACFSHMVYCMALTSAELKGLSDEIRRVLKPGGLNVYTARNTADPQYRVGIHRGEDMYEIGGGFIVHFFSRDKVERLAEGFELLGVEQLEESSLPRRLFLVTLRRPNR